jgi:hypothetical protein
VLASFAGRHDRGPRGRAGIGVCLVPWIFDLNRHVVKWAPTRSRSLVLVSIEIDVTPRGFPGTATRLKNVHEAPVEVEVHPWHRVSAPPAHRVQSVPKRHVVDYSPGSPLPPVPQHPHVAIPSRSSAVRPTCSPWTTLDRSRRASPTSTARSVQSCSQSIRSSPNVRVSGCPQ